MRETPVLDKGFVRLDAAMADDLSVVNGARVSFAERSEYDYVCLQCENGECSKTEACIPWTPKLKDRDAGLISYLMRERHGSPFEHNAFRFHIKCPIFVAREWMRHRIGSFNEMSGRYTKLEPDFYVPKYVRTQVGKPGAYEFEPVTGDEAEYARNLIRSANTEAWAAYEQMLENGIAKEVARMALPVNIYTQFYWTINARSLMNYLSLRNDRHAQFEIRKYAKVVEDIFAQYMPMTHAAFVGNGRVAP